MARPRSSIRGVDQLEEQIQYERFLSRLSAAARHEDSEREKSRITAPGNSARDPTTTPNSKSKKSLSMDHLQRLTDIAFLTNLAHKHSRISSMCGEGFYTIGPCGEELLAAVALALRSSDPCALHYRHVATNLARSAGLTRDNKDMQNHSDESWNDLLFSLMLDKARGYTCSSLDPVTGGVHCSLGGGPQDYLVTSTLSSQTPVAVGRALAIPLAQFLHTRFNMKNSDSHTGRVCPQPHIPGDAVSYVSIGDGSINNAHFLTALNMAEYAQHQGIKCPLVMGISNNNICISLRGQGYLTENFLPRHSGVGMGMGLQLELGPGSRHRNRLRVFESEGTDINDVYTKTAQAVDYARLTGRPSIVLYDDLPRRFGHAATDRQAAYLSPEEIRAQAMENPLENLCRLVNNSGKETLTVRDDDKDAWWRYGALHNRLLELDEMCEEAFDRASIEPKASSLGRQHQMDRLKPERSPPLGVSPSSDSNPALSQQPKIVQRKHMTRVISETLESYPNAIYLGEDVVHGGYYLVTDGLAKAYPHRVRDFPPDETSLFGAALGSAQTGLLPILEMPYAKYLDCGADMFFELCLTHWLAGGRPPNSRTGIMIRLQGFDRGVFGGNFHTHNALHLPPGIDVVCYSNGQDYTRGWRYCMRQVAEAGRLVMSVDPTDLLNRRDADHLLPYIEGETNELSWDNVILHRIDNKEGQSSEEKQLARQYVDGNEKDNEIEELKEWLSGCESVIITYGTGVNEARKALRETVKKGSKSVVIDCPLLSEVPSGLRSVMQILSDVKSEKSTKKKKKANGKDKAKTKKKELKSMNVTFADPCKAMQSPLARHALALQNEGLLPSDWKSVGAIDTYNPLGSTITFLSAEDIIETLK
eukprot:g2436.t1